MAGTPKVSVIIPVHDTAGYVDECLASICGQTWTDLEIICVDDGSQDDSRAQLDRWASQDDRIQVVGQDNRGVSAARNAGLDRATGDYIALLDSDDSWDRATARTVVDLAESSGADIVVYGGDGPSKDAWAWEYLHVPDALFDNSREALFAFKGSRSLINKFFRTTLVSDHHLRFDTSLPLGEDAAFLFSAFPYASTVEFCSSTLYHYRFRRQDSAVVVHDQSRRLRIDRHLNLITTVLESWNAHGFLTGYEEPMVSWMVELLYPDIPHLGRDERADYANRIRGLLARYGLPSALSQADTVSGYELESILRARGVAAKAWHRLATQGPSYLLKPLAARLTR